MTITSDNFTSKLAVCFFGPPSGALTSIGMVIDSMFDELHEFNAQQHVIDHQSNIANWRDAKRIPVDRRHSVSHALVLAYLGAKREKARDPVLLQQLVDFVGAFSDGKERQSSSSTMSSCIHFRPKAIQVTSPVSAKRDQLVSIATEIPGVYLSYRYRFNRATKEFPAIAVEVLYIYGGAVGRGDPNDPSTLRYPHFVYWYRRGQTALARYFGVIHPAGQSVWLQGFDEQDNHRMRILTLNQWPRKESDALLRRVLGGIMLSDSSDAGEQYPVAARTILCLQDTVEVDKSKTYADQKDVLEGYATKYTEYHDPASLEHPHRKKLLAAIDNESTPLQGRHVLAMPQSLIYDLMTI